MFSIFNDIQIEHNLEWLSVDMHSHLLTGIDHESLDLDIAAAYIKQLSELGVHKIYCTSAITPGSGPNFTNKLLTAKEHLQDILHEADIDVTLVAGAKYLVDSEFIVTDDLITLPGNRVLLKMSYMEEAQNLEDTIFDLQDKGYQVVLANPERYEYYHEDDFYYKRLKELGVFFELNLMSVMGHYGAAIKKMADYLLKKGAYEFAGTEGHGKRHLDMLLRNMVDGGMFDKTRHYSFYNKAL